MSTIHWVYSKLDIKGWTTNLNSPGVCLYLGYSTFQLNVMAPFFSSPCNSNIINLIIHRTLLSSIWQNEVVALELKLSTILFKYKLIFHEFQFQASAPQTVKNSELLILVKYGSTKSPFIIVTISLSEIFSITTDKRLKNQPKARI